MNVINPFAGSIVQSVDVQKQQADAKSSQLRRQQERLRNVAVEGDRYIHTVKSADELNAIGQQPDDARQGRKRRRTCGQNPQPQEEQTDATRLDLKA